MSCGLGARVVLHDLWSRVWFSGVVRGVVRGERGVSAIKNVLRKVNEGKTLLI